MYNIVFINSLATLGGAENSLSTLIERLNRNTFTPTVLLPRSGPLADRLVASGVEVVYVEGLSIYRRNPRVSLPVVMRVVKAARTCRADMLVSNLFICNPYAVMAARWLGIPCISYPRNLLEKATFDHYLLGRPHVLVATSQVTSENYTDLSSRKQYIEIIHNAVDTEYFTNGLYDKFFLTEKGLNDGSFTIGLIAGIWKSKGHHILIEALPEVLKVCPKVRVLMVGGSRTRQADYIMRLHTRMWELGIADRVIFTGEITDMPPVYDALDLVAFPTLKEAFGRTLIEAMAMKVPVVASATGGVLEVVKEGMTGFLVPPDDSKALAAAIIRFIEDPELRIRMGEQGRKWIEDSFSITSHVKKTEELFSQVCERKK